MVHDTVSSLPLFLILIMQSVNTSLLLDVLSADE